MENTEPKKSVDDAFHERFGRPLKNGSEVKFTAGGDTMLVSEKEILDFIHSYTASREKSERERVSQVIKERSAKSMSSKVPINCEPTELLLKAIYPSTSDVTTE